MRLLAPTIKKCSSGFIAKENEMHMFVKRYFNEYEIKIDVSTCKIDY